MSLQVVILAGGLGSRVKDLTTEIPKALIPISGVPFLQRQLDFLKKQSLLEIVISVGYKAHMISEFVAGYAKNNPAMRIKVVDEGTRLRGTAGALRFCADQGVLQREFFILYGDSYLPITFESVADHWRLCTGRNSSQPQNEAAKANDGTQKVGALMTVYRNRGAYDKSNVIYDHELNKVELYSKAPSDNERARMEFIDYGLSIMARETVMDHVPEDGLGDLSILYEKLSRQGRLASVEIKERFYEIGSYQGIRDLEDLFRSPNSQKNH